MENVDVGLVLACYNETFHFEKSMEDILAVLDCSRWSYEIVFVDDRSSDSTREMIDACIAANPTRRMRRLFHETNRGRGRTVSDGFKESRARIVGYIDIDLEIHARYLPSCIRGVEGGADIAVAHRIYKFELRSLDRYLMSKGYVWLERKLLRVPFKDTESGLKFFRRDRLLPLLEEIEDEGWFWDTEVMVRGLLRGYTVTEIPTLFLRRFDKRSTVRGLRDSLGYFNRLLRFRKELKERYGLDYAGVPGNRPQEGR